MAKNLQSIKQIFNMFTKSPTYARICKKLQFVGASKGSVQCKFVVEEEHTNLNGTMHGGFTATVVDQISTLALLTTEPYKFGVSVELSVSYLRAAPLGEEINVDAKALKIGKTLSFLTVDFTDSKGRLIAQGKHTKYL